jgi:chemotaxis protein histidine kinase CheA
VSIKVFTQKERLLALRLNFIHDLPEMMEQLTTDCAGMIDGHPDPDAMARVQRRAHTLAGSAGTFGLAEFSKYARELEDSFVSAQEAGRVPEPASLRLGVAALEAALVQILTSLQTTMGGPP